VVRRFPESPIPTSLIIPMMPIQLTATIVSAYVSKNIVPSAEIPAAVIRA
jgi:hypothetical protein